jgi:hypothetical protein
VRAIPQGRKGGKEGGKKKGNNYFGFEFKRFSSTVLEVSKKKILFLNKG